MVNVLKDIKQQMIEEIRGGIRENYREAEIPSIIIKKNNKAGYGEYTSTIAFQLGKVIGQPPRVVGEKIKESMYNKVGWVKYVEVAGSGFLNFVLDPSWKIQVLKELHKEGSLENYIIDVEAIKNIKGRVGEESWGAFEKEAQYILFRSRWVLYRYEKEGVLPKVEELRWKDISECKELELIDRIIDYLEELEGNGFNEKSFLTLQRLCESFIAYHSHVIIRHLAYPERNILLNIMVVMVKILEKWIPTAEGIF